jgi:hypothetical protein
MSNTLISHGGGEPEGFDVTTGGTRIAAANSMRKFIAITNASDTPVYLSLRNGATNTAVVGAGVFLAAEGGAFELNNVNMYFGDIWAIHGGAGTKRVCVQRGQ